MTTRLVLCLVTLWVTATGLVYSVSAAPSKPLIPPGDPPDTVIAPGACYYLEVQPDGTPPFDCQWYKDGNRIPDATNRWFEFVSFSAADVARYRIVITNEVGSTTSRVARITLGTSPPTIVANPYPASWQAQPGEVVSFCAAVSGPQPIRMDWERIPEEFGLSGERCLDLAPVDLTHSGLYRLIAENNNGAVTSRVCVLAVSPATVLGVALDKPELIVTNDATPWPWDVEVDANQTRDGLCAVRSGPISAWQSASFGAAVTGPINVQFWWRIDADTGAFLDVAVDGSVSNIISGQTAWQQETLTLAEGEHTLAWTFYKQSFASVGEDAAWVDQLTLTPIQSGNPPGIIIPPARQVARLGEAVEFSVSAEGAAPLAYQWFKDGSALSGGVNATYRIPAVAESDVGTYWVEVTNGFGQAVSDPVTLTVPSLPRITRQPESYVVYRGAAVVLSASAQPGSSGGPLTYQWLKDYNLVPGATSPDLVLANVQSAQAGRYSLWVNGADGHTESAPAIVAVLPISERALPGALDRSFARGNGDIDGRVSVMISRPDGSLMLGGAFNRIGDYPRRGLAQCSANGAVDPSFNPWNQAGLGYWDVRGLAVETDETLLACGQSFREAERRTGAEPLLVRLRADGTRDGSFTTAVQNSAGSASVNCVLRQPDGRIVIAGTFDTVNGLTRSNLARLNVDGTVDQTFSASAGVNGTVEALVLQPDGAVIAGGSFYQAASHPQRYVARFHSDGAVDAAYNPGTNFWVGVFALALQPDGKVLIGSGWRHKLLARFHPDGSLDNTFTPGWSPTEEDAVHAILAQADGRIVIGGTFHNYGNHPYARSFLARLEANGEMDGTFLPGPFGAADLRALVRQADGRLVAAGQLTTVEGMGCPNLARFWTDGAVAGEPVVRYPSTVVPTGNPENPVNFTVTLGHESVSLTPTDPGAITMQAAPTAGTPPYSYQWLSNGVPIPDATNMILMIPAIGGATTNTTYSVQINNAQGGGGTGGGTVVRAQRIKLRVVDLGIGRAGAINNQGVVAGELHSPTFTVFRYERGLVSGLGFSGWVWDINDACTLVGVSGTSPAYPFVYVGNSHSLLSGSVGAARGINRSGEIVGGVDELCYPAPGPGYDLPQYCFSRPWSTGGSSLPFVLGSAAGINDQGTIVGSIGSGQVHTEVMNDCSFFPIPGCYHSNLVMSATYHAFVASGGAVTDLHARLFDDAPPSPQRDEWINLHDSTAIGINNRGQVIGHALWRSWIWDGQRTTWLPAEPWKEQVSRSYYAWAINLAGHVAGYVRCSGCSGISDYGFLHSGGAFRNLNSCIETNGGWEIASAWDINDRGQIAAQGYGPDGQLHALLLTTGTETAVFQPRHSQAGPGQPGPGYDQWLPQGGTDELTAGNTIEFVAEIKPGIAGATNAVFTFQLQNVSREPGVCLNRPWSPQPVPPDVAGQSLHDLRFEQRLNPDLVVWPDGQTATSTRYSPTQAVVISCFDYGAYGELKVIATPEGGGPDVIATVAGAAGRDALTLPKDENVNRIADSWEDALGIKTLNLPARWEGTLDVARYTGQASAGDGLTLYEKYRGFMVYSTFTGASAHERLRPHAKYVFIYDQHRLVESLFDSPYGAPVGFPAASYCEVRYVASDGWTGPGAFADGKRVVNFNCSPETHVMNQHAVHVTVDTSAKSIEPMSWVSLMASVGILCPSKACPAIGDSQGITWPDPSAPHTYCTVQWDTTRPGGAFQVQIFPYWNRDYVRACIKYHHTNVWGGLDPAQRDAETDKLMATQDAANKVTLQLSATVTHELGHVIGIRHHAPDEYQPSTPGQPGFNCTMRYYLDSEFPINVADPYELSARGLNPNRFCSVYNCWNSIQVSDNPGAPTTLGPGSTPSPSPLPAPQPVVATFRQMKSQGSAMLSLSADLVWTEMVAGDPLRVWTRLHGPTDLLATNWSNGLRLTLYRVIAEGQRQLVLNQDRWSPFLQPVWFDTAWLAIPNVTRIREWLAPPAAANLTAGQYSLEIAWDGNGLAPAEVLPANGLLSTPAIQFEVRLADTPARQAVNERHLAWASYLADDVPGTIAHARQAASLDPEAADPLAVQTQIIHVTAAAQQADLLEAAVVLNELSRKLPANADWGRVVQARLDILTPRLAVLAPPADGEPVRLRLHAIPGENYVLQASSDFVNWAALSTNRPSATPFELMDAPSPGSDRRFYRVLWTR